MNKSISVEIQKCNRDMVGFVSDTGLFHLVCHDITLDNPWQKICRCTVVRNAPLHNQWRIKWDIIKGGAGVVQCIQIQMAIYLWESVLTTIDVSVCCLKLKLNSCDLGFIYCQVDRSPKSVKATSHQSKYRFSSTGTDLNRLYYGKQESWSI